MLLRRCCSIRIPGREDGTVALGGTSFSEDGQYLAYGVQDAGSDWNTGRVMNVETKTVLDDELKWLKFTSAALLKDGSGFFYARYPEPEPGAAFQKLNLNQKVYFHKLGTKQADDKLVFANPEEPTWGFQAEVSDDGKYLVITAWKGTDDNYRVQDLLGSQGFISYRIKPNSDIIVGDVLENTAGIYFDFNPPIITNTVEHAVDFSTVVRTQQLDHVLLQPNPVSDQLWILSDGSIDVIAIQAADGREIGRRALRATTSTIDVSGLHAGAYFLVATMNNGSVVRERFLKQ